MWSIHASIMWYGVLSIDAPYSLTELIKENCEQISVEIIEMEIMTDHVHLLIEVDP